MVVFLIVNDGVIRKQVNEKTGNEFILFSKSLNSGKISGQVLKICIRVSHMAVKKKH
jgi:hypothetical protein